MIRYKQLVTLDIIDKATNESIGKIMDILYSHDLRKIEYLIVKNNNLIKNKAPIPYKDINFINSNQALYLEDIKIFQKKLNENIGGKFKFIDKEIKLENGECVGYIKDIVINKEDGSISGFIITEGLIEDLIKGRNYIPFLKNTYIKDNSVYIPYKSIV
ncbi:PRC-barrel domain-containing protein [Schnuerera sp.]|uniref:PRC-barrel domain-containing protein n=1 Tax=Schnuerera sp. TaxID=2794844 RepID=UPI002BF96F69|nr:PRC-barrel domain-containing protein [Schnuerera sp.]HSH35687.1 PRC-barrel domain-containing protein [Schnuerera sp.]